MSDKTHYMSSVEVTDKIRAILENVLCLDTVPKELKEDCKEILNQFSKHEDRNSAVKDLLDESNTAVIPTRLLVAVYKKLRDNGKYKIMFSSVTLYLL